jgi:hypothetical protein
MKLTAIIAVPVAALATLMAAGTAQAAPAPTSQVHYSITKEADSVLFATSDGKLVTTGDALQLVDAHGRVAAQLPLVYRLNNLQYPIKAAVEGNRARLTPQRAGGTPAADVTRTGATTLNQNKAAAAQSPQAVGAAALGQLVQQLTVGSITGSMVGTIVGATLGCLGGLAVGAAATAPVAWLLGAGPLAGCIGGGVLLAPVGTIAGTMLIGGPVLGVSLFQYFQATHS